MPADTTILTACSTVILRKITSSRGQNNKKPDVGFGVVGTNTLTIDDGMLLATSPFVLPVTKPITHNFFRGYSTKTTSRKASDCVEITVSKICLVAP